MHEQHVKSYNTRKVIDFETWQAGYSSFWETTKYSDCMDVAEEAEFSPEGCDCCAHIANKHGLGRLAGDVTECTDMEENTFQLCGCCLSVAVNGDPSWFDYYADVAGFLQI